MRAIHLGTSGYVYKHWKGFFYPSELPASRWLPYYARVFATVELNAPFYRLPTADAVDGWREQTPAGFLFACKGSRYLTHMKRLTDVGEGLERFFGVILRLRPKLGPVLWQLPPHMKKPDPARLDRFLSALPRDVRYVFEFRDAAWYHEEVLEVLDRWDAAVCEHDLVPVPPPRLTGGFRYVRFHGAGSRYAGRYGREAMWPVAVDLDRWRRKGRTAWVYFNNDLHGHALLDAFDLAELLGHVRVHPPADMRRPPETEESRTA
ncbi:DUF72 domain-containing protein [Archangium violaceum]|uniref:DUF72 domain-containing protein n=1 Tax=Archangium violaceum TaxID=83451 RepID=UPI00193BC854|nr:DUF72 domain-containing protein [Archangium violaceum]QRK07086.1 DUF72 domain-containing protein [Archangium violaceum]